MLDVKDQQEKIVQGSKQLLLSKAEVLRDYSLGVQSRQASLVGRREVMSGKAKFGIFGDGKEVAQIAMAKAFRKGDFRAGYYRDQTFMFALGATTMPQFFAQLYAHANVNADPNSAGRQMNSHYATRSLNPDGSWRNLTEMYNSSADLSPTAAQMPRLVGLGYASRLYRELEEIQHLTHFSLKGDEIAFGTIGNASCAEGLFWESVNAIGVLQAPVLLSIWDDEYGISVSNEYQLTKTNISELLNGFQRQPDSAEGLEILTVKGWDYPALLETYANAARIVRQDHVPVIIHVVEMTQPLGHSTSGSHERYKSDERLGWEEEYDCLLQMRQWVIEQRIAEPGELDQIERNAVKLVENYRVKAWNAFSRPIYDERQEAAEIIQQIANSSTQPETILNIRKTLLRKTAPSRRDIQSAVHQVLVLAGQDTSIDRALVGEMARWSTNHQAVNRERYRTHLLGETTTSALQVTATSPVYSADAANVPGAKILNAGFDAILDRDPRVFAFGEDVGKLGGVNQTWAGLQNKYGELRVTDTGIREATIVGQAIGMAMRGLRPIAEIQYLDYILYALQILSDDLASLHWRTKGGQKAPVIISTRGHRLEGIWHSGSPMAAIIHLLRGMHVCVPRNMTQAIGFYNTLLLGDEPGLVVEVLNGYRLKEVMPDNIGQITVPLGVPEVLRSGEDVTIVTYGASCRIALEAAERLQTTGVDTEIIDVQTLLPFDRSETIVKSLEKTSRILFLDEDVPGGTTAYMMQEVLENQGGFYWLDAEPRTLSAQAHRPAYGSDGAYFSKPNIEDVFNVVYDMMNEADPALFPAIFQLAAQTETNYGH